MGVMVELCARRLSHDLVPPHASQFVEDHEEALEFCRKLCRRFSMDEAAIEEEIRKAGAAVLVFALVPEHVTGKLVHEA